MKLYHYIFFVIFLTLTTSNNYGQFNNEFGFSFGPSNYLGEIGGIGHKPSRGFIGDLKLKQTSLSGGWFMRNKLSSNIAINTSINYTRISGDDAYTESGPRFWRNLRFRNDIIEVSPKFEFIFYNVPDVGKTGRYRTSLKLYAHLGVTAFYHNPKGSLDGLNWTALRGLQTEGVNYNRMGIGVPMGGGIVFTQNRYFRFGLVLNYTKTFTDYLDDVSSVYVSHPSGSQSASYANQSKGVAPENQMGNFAPGTIRGNPEDNDSYLNLSLTYSKYFMGRNKFYRGAIRNKYKRFNSKSFKKPKHRVTRAKF